jgi:hypothetical protein
MAKGAPTEADKNLWVSRKLAHEKDEDPALAEQARRLLKLPQPPPVAPQAPTATAVSVQTDSTRNSPTPKENSVQESPPEADEASTGFWSWGWFAGLAALVGLVFALYLALRR